MRKPVVSRTFTRNLVKVLVLDQDNTTREVQMMISRYKQKEKQVLETVSALLPQGKAVALLESKLVQQAYAMDEEEFIKLATPVAKVMPEDLEKEGN